MKDVSIDFRKFDNDAHLFNKMQAEFKLNTFSLSYLLKQLYKYVNDPYTTE